MRALQLTARWPVPNVSAAVLLPDGSVATIGDTTRTYRIASIAKMLVGWTLLIADEEGTLALDTLAGQQGCTVRHLLAHAGGYAFDGPDPIARPGLRRIDSNTGIDLAAAALAEAAQMPYGDYFAEAVLQPLQMRQTVLKGSPAHAVTSSVDDLLRFVRELVASQLLSPTSAQAFRSVQFPGLAGRAGRRPLWGLCVGPGDGVVGHETAALDRPAQLAGHVRSLRRSRYLGWIRGHAQHSIAAH